MDSLDQSPLHHIVIINVTDSLESCKDVFEVEEGDTSVGGHQLAKPRVFQLVLLQKHVADLTDQVQVVVELSAAVNVGVTLSTSSSDDTPKQNI